MPIPKLKNDKAIGNVSNPAELGDLMRTMRKSQKLTLEKVANYSNLSIRFLSELERGKETAELGKALKALALLGLEVIIQLRGTQRVLMRQLNIAHSKASEII